MTPAPPPMPASETMSQAEVERLLAMVGDEEAAATGATPAAAPAKAELGSSSRHDFPLVSSFSAADLRSLRVRHEAQRFDETLRLLVHRAFLSYTSNLHSIGPL